MTRPAAALALLLAASACAHGEAGSGASPPDGATLYRRNCAACHRLKTPSEHPPGTWRRAVERFGTHLTAEERRLVAEYLAANARTAP